MQFSNNCFDEVLRDRKFEQDSLRWFSPLHGYIWIKRQIFGLVIVKNSSDRDQIWCNST